MKISFLALLFILTFQARATQLEGAALLNKISMSLTGQPAALVDQKQLNQLSDADQKNLFISNKIDLYLKTAEYRTKMSTRLEELFQYRIAPSSIFPSFNLNNGVSETRLTNSTLSLFESLTQENLSWDTLITGKSYTLSNQQPLTFGMRVSDYGFFGNLVDLPATMDGYVGQIEDLADTPAFIEKKISFAGNDLRLAGALTTPLFFSRYATTGLNKNRRRAAAIFRIFLCDKMTAAIPAMETIDDATFNLLYPEMAKAQANKMGMTFEEVKAVLNNKDSLHGSKADCRVCHSKLDPMGLVFKTSSANLGSIASSGALSYKNAENQTLNIKVNGIAELATAITQQPEYVRCQIQHFWNWYIGQDIKLTSERLTTLQASFEKVNRKTNDFVKEILLTEEFSNRIIPNELKDVALGTKNLMQKCQSCHNNSMDYLGADLTKWPLGDQNDPENNSAYWIRRITKVLDLTHDGLKRSMPPKPSEGGFIPTRQELDLIKKWIELGAPDDSGARQVAP